MASLNKGPNTYAGTSEAFARLRDVTLAIFLIYILTQGFAGLLAIGHEAGQAGSNSNEGSLVNQIVLACITIAAAVSAFGMRVPIERMWRCMWPFLPLVLVVLVSVAWSGVPDVAARRGMRFFIEFAATLLLMAAFRRHPSRFFAIGTGVFAVILLADIVTLLFPNFSFTNIGFRGIHLHKNQAGLLALLALPFFLIQIRRNAPAQKNTVAIALVLIAVLVLILAQSKTSSVLFLVSIGLSGFVVFLLSLRGYTRRAAICFTAASTLAAGLMFAIWGITPLDLVGIAWDNETLTGRDQAWRFTYAAINESPLVGFGYGSFWGGPFADTKALLASGITFPWGQAHNGYLDVLVQLGWLGMLCVVMFFTLISVQLFSLSPLPCQRKQVFVCVYLITAFWLHNLTESTLIRPGAALWVFFVFASLALFTFFDGKNSAVATEGARAEKLVRLPLPSARFE